LGIIATVKARNVNQKFSLELLMSKHDPTLRYMGVDGCRFGWFCVELGERQARHVNVIEDIDTLSGLAKNKLLVLVDVPIGLLDRGGPQRQCDRAARKVLGVPRASSIFPVPARATLHAKNYPEAVALNLQRLGVGLNKQSWNIVPKIKDMDRLLRNNRRLHFVIRESHPEVCFWALNNRQAMAFNKKQTRGHEERLTVLERYLPKAREIFFQTLVSYRRQDVAPDDIIDALVLAVTARLACGNIQTLPVKPQTDQFGLPMEMVYALARISHRDRSEGA
jgi:predicted RNase H-like nuclease